MDERRWAEVFKGNRYKKSQTVLDFGSGEGHYTIPASKVVGASAKVYALDKDKNVLDKLKNIAKKNNIKNIELIEEDSKIPLRNNSVDAVLCYDVIHYGKKRKRITIYNEVHRVLKKQGLFSVYPKHHRQDYPLDELADIDLEDIIKEIEKSSFRLKENFRQDLLHDNYYNKGVILNFTPLNK